MGIRGEIFSTRLILPNRTYFLNVKENRMGDLYLNIVESKNKESGGFERQSVIVFAEDLPYFLGEFDKALKVMEKAARGKKPDGHKEFSRKDHAQKDSHKDENKDFSRKDSPPEEVRSKYFKPRPQGEGYPLARRRGGRKGEDRE
jgi:hypothetical protein